MKIEGKVVKLDFVSADKFAVIEISLKSLASQLTNEQWDEIKLIKWQLEKPQLPELCSCEKPEEDLSNGIHPGYCKHCHFLLPQTLPHAKEPLKSSQECYICGGKDGHHEMYCLKGFSPLKDNKEPIEEMKIGYSDIPSKVQALSEKLNELIRQVNRGGIDVTKL